MLAQLCLDTSFHLHELDNPILLMYNGEERVYIFWILARRAGYIAGNVEGFEATVPFRHPSIRRKINDGHPVPGLDVPGVVYVATTLRVVQNDFRAK